MLERAPLLGFDIDRDEVRRRLGLAPSGPARHDRSAVRRQVELRFHEHRTGIAGDVDRLQPERLGFDRAFEVRRQRGRKQPLALGSEPVIPISNRAFLKQQRPDAGVLASLHSGRVVLEIRRRRMDEHAERDRIGVPCRRNRPDPTFGSQEQPRLAAVGRQQPEPVDLVVRVRLRVRVRARGSKEERAVASEGRVRLTGWGDGQPPGRPLAQRIDLPDRPHHGFSVGRFSGDRDGEPAAVGRQAQTRQPRGLEVPIEGKRLTHSVIIAHPGTCPIG